MDIYNLYSGLPLKVSQSLISLRKSISMPCKDRFINNDILLLFAHEIIFKFRIRSHLCNGITFWGENNENMNMPKIFLIAFNKGITISIHYINYICYNLYFVFQKGKTC